MKTYVYIPGFEYDSKGPVLIDAIELHASIVGSVKELNIYTGPPRNVGDDLILENVIYRSTQSSTYLSTYQIYNNSISYTSPFYTEARSLGRVNHGFFYDFTQDNYDGSLHHTIGIHDDIGKCKNNVFNMNRQEHDGLFAVALENPNTDILLDFTFYTRIKENSALDPRQSVNDLNEYYTKIYSISKVYNPALSAGNDEGQIMPATPLQQYFDITQLSSYYWELPVNAGVLVTRMLPESEKRSLDGKKVYAQYSYDMSQRKHVLDEELACNKTITQLDSIDFFINFYKNSVQDLGDLNKINYKYIFDKDKKLEVQYTRKSTKICLLEFNCQDHFRANFSYNITGVDLKNFAYLYKLQPSVCLQNKLYDNSFYSSNRIYPLSVSIDHLKAFRDTSESILGPLDYIFDCNDVVSNVNKYELDGDPLSNTQEYQKIKSNSTDYFYLDSGVSYFHNTNFSNIFNSDSAICVPKDNINWRANPVTLYDDRHLYAAKLIAGQESSRPKFTRHTLEVPDFFTYLLFQLHGNTHNGTSQELFNKIENSSLFFDGNLRIIPLEESKHNKFGLTVDINSIGFAGFYQIENEEYALSKMAGYKTYVDKYNYTIGQVAGNVMSYLTNMIYVDLNRSNIRFNNHGDYLVIPMFVNSTHGVDTSVQSSHLVESNVIDTNLLADGSDEYEIKNVISGANFETPLEMGFKSSFCNEKRFIKYTKNNSLLTIGKTKSLTPGVYVIKILNAIKDNEFIIKIDSQKDSKKYLTKNRMLLMYVPTALNIKFDYIKWNEDNYSSGNTNFSVVVGSSSGRNRVIQRPSGTNDPTLFIVDGSSNFDSTTVFDREEFEDNEDTIDLTEELKNSKIIDFISGVGLYKIDTDSINLKSSVLDSNLNKDFRFRVEENADNYNLVVFKSAVCARENVKFCKRNTRYGHNADYFVESYGNDPGADESEDTIYQYYNFPYLPKLACYNVVAFYEVPVNDVPIQNVEIIDTDHVSEDSSLITQLKSKKARV